MSDSDGRVLLFRPGSAFHGRTENDVLRMMHAWCDALAAEAAAAETPVLLRTADGCTRTMVWRGRPPQVIRTPLARKVSLLSQEAPLHADLTLCVRCYRFSGMRGTTMLYDEEV